MNIVKFKVKLIENELNVEKIAIKIGMPIATFYRKMKDGSFTVKQVIAIANCLNLTHDEIMSIFFETIVA